MVFLKYAVAAGAVLCAANGPAFAQSNAAANSSPAAAASSKGATISASDPVPLKPSAPSGSAEILTNDTIVKLLGVGLSNEAIIAKIHASKTNFDLSTDQLITLKKEGVPSPVIAAMIEPQGSSSGTAAAFSTDSPNPTVPHYPGVYLQGPATADQKMLRITPTASNQAKVGNILGYAFTMGIASMSVKVTIPGAHGRVKTLPAKPVFYFYFDESVPQSLQGGQSTVWSSGNGNLVTSPSELSLVKFEESDGNRQAKIGSVNIAGAKSGVMDKDRIAFEAEAIAPGIFRVTVQTELKPGEYGFIQATGAGSMAGNGAGSARVFDFSVAAP
jgi:hypothetical protein